MRPHTNNLCNCQETAPDRIGDMASNLANIRLRYALSPYYYSLAHRAYLYGEPLFAPLVYYYQQDGNVRELGAQKMIGPDLMAGFSATLFQEFMDVYLPAGKWVDFHTFEWHNSAGEWLEKYPLIRDDLYQPPLFQRAGSIIPLMVVDDQTMDIMGLRKDGTTRDELVLRVVASQDPSTFTLYEDDGTSIAYQNGAVRTTKISQQQEGDYVKLTVDAARGSYTGANQERNTWIELVINNEVKPKGITINGAPLVEAATEAEWIDLDSGWFLAGPNLVKIKTGKLGVDLMKVIEVIS